MARAKPLGMRWLGDSVRPTARALGRLRRGEPAFFSFNIADRCPIGCHCYWRAQERVRELSDDDVVRFFETRRDEGYVHATLVGGEPYVRPDLLTRLVGIVPWNWIVTSGTTPLRRLPGATHFVSIDGATAATHDAVRRSQGLYERVLRNVAQARDTHDEFPLYLHVTLNAANRGELGGILATWQENGMADGVIVSTMTPIAGAEDERLRLSPEDRRGIIGDLRRLKAEYGDFLAMTNGMIAALEPAPERTPSTCGTARTVASFDAAGERIAQCILSEKADCSACGCVITAMTEPFLRGVLPRSREDARTLVRLASYW